MYFTEIAAWAGVDIGFARFHLEDKVGVGDLFQLHIGRAGTGRGVDAVAEKELFPAVTAHGDGYRAGDRIAFQEAAIAEDPFITEGLCAGGGNHGVITDLGPDSRADGRAVPERGICHIEVGVDLVDLPLRGAGITTLVRSTFGAKEGQESIGSVPGFAAVLLNT